jgi:hypothetical protein
MLYILFVLLVYIYIGLIQFQMSDRLNEKLLNVVSI